jgi:hypothetical protein
MIVILVYFNYFILQLLANIRKNWPEDGILIPKHVATARNRKT